MIGRILRTKFGALTGGRQEAASRYAQFAAPNNQPIVLVTLLSTDALTRDQAIQTHAGKTSHRAVFLVTDPDVAAFQNRRCIVEHLPSPPMVLIHADAGDWQGYLQERWRVLHLKWGPRWTVCYGHNFQTYLQECGISGKMPA